jgi:hypothetical protein
MEGKRTEGLEFKQVWEMQWSSDPSLHRKPDQCQENSLFIALRVSIQTAAQQLRRASAVKLRPSRGAAPACHGSSTGRSSTESKPTDVSKFGSASSFEKAAGIARCTAIMSSLIIVDTSSVEARAGAAATANLWLVIDGREFPSRGWNDVVVVVLSWWATALLRLFHGTSTQERVNFMDGPYTVEVSGPLAGMLRFRALEGSGRTHETALGGAPAVEFATSVIAQGRQVLEACRRKSGGLQMPSRSNRR